ncbi:MAG: rod-binding protein [Fidelibacterota bacterium]|nr:MAG: rod-binding protein [Candidatus Neomarinimicrobiota bacterium]
MEIKGTEHQGIPIRPKGSSAPAGQSPAAGNDKQLWKACQNFEALFMGYLVKSMERTLPQGSLSSSGLPDLMFDQVMGSALSEGGGIGLAELLYRDLQSQTFRDSSENDNGISLQDLLTRNVRKEENDQASSR